MIADSVALGDLSMLAPLSVKDAIWIEAERALAAEENGKNESAKFKYLTDRFDRLEMYLSDARHLLTLAEFSARLAAVKGSKSVKKMKPIDPKTLPSVEMMKAKEERELSDEQKAERDRLKLEREKLRMQRLQQMQEIQQLVESANTPEEMEAARRLVETKYADKNE